MSVNKSRKRDVVVGYIRNLANRDDDEHRKDLSELSYAALERAYNSMNAMIKLLDNDGDEIYLRKAWQYEAMILAEYISRSF